jgi:hypothetical protein
LAIAVTHWLKGVPLVPSAASDRFLLWSWQWRPYALALAGRSAFGPGVAGLRSVPRFAGGVSVGR